MEKRFAPERGLKLFGALFNEPFDAKPVKDPEKESRQRERKPGPVMNEEPRERPLVEISVWACFQEPENVVHGFEVGGNRPPVAALIRRRLGEERTGNGFGRRGLQRRRGGNRPARIKRRRYRTADRGILHGFNHPEAAPKFRHPLQKAFENAGAHESDVGFARCYAAEHFREFVAGEVDARKESAGIVAAAGNFGHADLVGHEVLRVGCRSDSALNVVEREGFGFFCADDEASAYAAVGIGKVV